MCKQKPIVTIAAGESSVPAGLLHRDQHEANNGVVI
jgi:hypothetical protein